MSLLLDVERTLETSRAANRAIDQLRYSLGAALEVAPPEKRGGTFCMMNWDDADTNCNVVLSIGEIPYEKKAKYLDLACEKARRLKSTARHVSSWQSRSPDDGRWGGAVRGRRFIYSFSGFPEMLDEAMMLFQAMLCQDLSVDEAQAIADLSTNPFFSKLRDKFDR